jgi:hypothetical protein
MAAVAAVEAVVVERAVMVAAVAVAADHGATSTIALENGLRAG